MAPTKDTTPAAIVRRPPPPLDSILDTAIDGALTASFQPIVSFENNYPVTVGHELLARIDGATPLELLARAAAHKQTFELERSMIEAAGRAVVQHAPGGLVFVNASPGVVCDNRFTSVISGFQSLTRDSCSGVVIELTEQATGPKGRLLAQRCNELRDMGAAIAIDDLGASGSGLTRLAVLRPEWIKIDRHLVGGISTDPYRLELLRSITTFAESWGATVLAEGLESPQDCLAVRQAGITHGQGYLLGRPIANPLRPSGNRAAA